MKLFYKEDVATEREMLERVGTRLFNETGGDEALVESWMLDENHIGIYSIDDFDFNQSGICETVRNLHQNNEVVYVAEVLSDEGKPYFYIGVN